MPRDCVPCVDGEPFRDEVIDRAQARGPVKSTRNPGPVINHLANIVRNRKADLKTRQASLVRSNEDIATPTKFSMPRPVPPSSPPASPDNDSGRGSPSDEILREPTLSDGKVSVGILTVSPPSARLAALKSRFDTLYVDSSRRVLSRASSKESLDSGHSAGVPDLQTNASINRQNDLENYFLDLVPTASDKAGTCVDEELSLGTTHSDYESDFSESSSDISGSLSPSSPPGSPDAFEPSPWSQAYTKALGQPPFSPDGNVTWADVKDAVGQLNAAIADEDNYLVPGDAIELLRVAELHIASRDFVAAHATLMRALDGVTEIQSLSKSFPPRTPSPDSPELASDLCEDVLTDKECADALDHCLERLTYMAGAYAGSARGREAKALHAAAMEMFKRSSVRAVYTFLEPSMQDLIHFPTTARPVNRPEVLEGFWT
jgi:hypothetical protein